MDTESLFVKVELGLPKAIWLREILLEVKVVALQNKNVDTAFDAGVVARLVDDSIQYARDKEKRARHRLISRNICRQCKNPVEVSSPHFCELTRGDKA